jgi:hypothetical protein
MEGFRSELIACREITAKFQWITAKYCYDAVIVSAEVKSSLEVTSLLIMTSLFTEFSKKFVSNFFKTLKSQ